MNYRNSLLSVGHCRTQALPKQDTRSLALGGWTLSKCVLVKLFEYHRSLPPTPESQCNHTGARVSLISMVIRVVYWIPDENVEIAR